MEFCSFVLCLQKYNLLIGNIKRRRVSLTSSFKLWPEEKTFPVDEITIQRKDDLSCPWVIPSISSFIVAMDKEFLQISV